MTAPVPDHAALPVDELRRMLAVPIGPRRPPIACAACRTPIRKFFREGEVWFPCRDCDGVLCESCCEKSKKNRGTR